MKRVATVLLLTTFAVSFAGCDGFLDEEPQNILTEEDVFTNASLVEGVLANHYARLSDPFYMDLQPASAWAYIDEALWSGSGGEFQNNLGTYPYGEWGLYEGADGYGLVRDLNDLIAKLKNTEAVPGRLDAEQIARFEAEARFIRAAVYFEMVKRMGGVPLITQVYTYEGPESVGALQRARSTEKEVYDFVIAELDTVQADLPASGASKTRASQWTAKAVQGRAQLYAASIAKYNDERTPEVEVPSSENLVGMSNADPMEYYRDALATAEDIIQNGPYSLYEQNDNLQENFYEAIVNENANPEVIWAQDYVTSQLESSQGFNFEVMPRSARDDNINSASLSPALDLVEAFEYQDGAAGGIQTCQDAAVKGYCMQNGSDYVHFDEKSGPFENKDPRLWGTVMYPGSTYRGAPLDFQTGVAVWNDSTGSYDFEQGTLGSEYGGGGLLTGLDGPLEFVPNTSNTGFYVRKYVDTEPGAGNRNQGSGVWWVKYRYAEVLLNAAEAAFELGQESKALDYLNQVRGRSGMPDLTSLTLEDFVQERRVELAFEDHRVWDLKRWRLAHEIWDGTRESDDAWLDAMFLYRVVHPGDAAKDGTYIYVQRHAPRHSNPRFFRLGNYYSAFSNTAVSSNPELVRNPFH